jgi:pimeloyl-ACP methyl ester carboxylesterase
MVCARGQANGVDSLTARRRHRSGERPHERRNTNLYNDMGHGAVNQDLRSATAWPCTQRLLVALAFSFLFPSAAHAQAPAGRPILFVHGWCGDSEGFASLRDSTVAQFRTFAPTLYTDSTVYTLYYDRNADKVKVFPFGTDIRPVPGLQPARFFAIDFFASGAIPTDGRPDIHPIDKSRVAEVSILNKADELARVIGMITSITHVKDVIVIAHSMGGLDARAYMQNWAVPALCSDANNYQSCLAVGATAYTKDIAKLITIDTPHSGAYSATFFGSLIPVSTDLACFSDNTLTRRELDAHTNPVVVTLSGTVSQLPSDVGIDAVQSYTTGGLALITGIYDDGIVTKDEQSIEKVTYNRSV